MAYVQPASATRDARLEHRSWSRPAGTSLFAYAAFAISFGFAAALVLGIVP